jgi:hypothetical protein
MRRWVDTKSLFGENLVGWQLGKAGSHVRANSRSHFPALICRGNKPSRQVDSWWGRPAWGEERAPDGTRGTPEQAKAVARDFTCRLRCQPPPDPLTTVAIYSIVLFYYSCQLPHGQREASDRDTATSAPSIGMGVLQCRSSRACTVAFSILDAESRPRRFPTCHFLPLNTYFYRS